MDEQFKNVAAALAARSVAGGIFQQSSDMIANIPTISDHLRAIFSSGTSITSLAQEVKIWKDEAPDGKHLVVLLRTPNGEIMDVSQIRPSGWQCFIAEGYIKDMPCKVAGHIATLSIFCSYEETRKGKNPAGFTIITEPLNEPQPLPEQPAPDNTTQTP